MPKLACRWIPFLLLVLAAVPLPAQRQGTGDSPTVDPRESSASAPGDRPAIEEPAPTLPNLQPDSRTARAETRGDRQQADVETDPSAEQFTAENAKPDRSPLIAEHDLTPETTEFRDKIRRCLSHHYFHPETTAERSPWGVMHALIGFGVDTQLLAGGRKVNAIAWMCWNGPCYGMRLFTVDQGRLYVRMGPGYQGHEGQFLAMMAQSRVRSDYAMKIDGHDLTIADLVRYEQLTCKSGTELTFKLIGLVHYLDSDATWKNFQGESWNLERLIAEELSQPVIGAACGGTHRMMGFSYAVRKRRERGEPLDGQWQRAKQYVDDYHEYAFKLQNADGSFSTNWFEGRGDAASIDRRLQTTGHMLEWLVYSLPKEQLADPRVVLSVDYLANLMLTNQNYNWEIGPKGHAIRALALFDERVFGGKPGERSTQLAAIRDAARR